MAPTSQVTKVVKYPGRAAMSLLSDIASPTPMRRSPISGRAYSQIVVRMRPGMTKMT